MHILCVLSNKESKIHSFRVLKEIPLVNFIYLPLYSAVCLKNRHYTTFILSVFGSWLFFSPFFFT